MTLLSVVNLNKFSEHGENRVHILKNVTINIDSGEFVAIVGPSGSGKSTLMNVLGCLDVPTSGSYTVEGVETRRMDEDQLAALRSKKFGFIFQHYNLLRNLTALENVALPAIYAVLPRKERLVRAQNLLQKLGLNSKLANKPHELSGGQQQRVSIARALMNGGEVILADEPTGALDTESGKSVMQVLSALNQKGHTIVIVTHSKDVANHANRIIEIRDGEVISDYKKNIGGHKEKKMGTNYSQFKAIYIVKNQLFESLKISIHSIISHKLRSLLTMIGIIIGIASVVTMVALGRGSQEKILADIRAMGPNTIEIFPGKGFGDMQAWRIESLKVDDVDALSTRNYLDGATPIITAPGISVSGRLSANILINGVNSKFSRIKGLQMELGRFLVPEDIENNASVAVIDKKTKIAFFSELEHPIGKIIICNNQPLKIIGIIKENKMALGASDNPNIFIPYSTAMYKIFGNDRLNSIIVKVIHRINPQVAEKNLTQFLIARHEGKKDFFTYNMDSVKKTVEKTTNTLKILIIGIAVISLAVGGIGVMNIMLVSVSERTVEIGIRMAIGARRYNVLAQFLIEAVLICLLGGFGGIVLSFLASPIFDLFTESFALSYSWTSIILAFFCSIFIGVLFGFIPARNASQLSPIAALARE